MRSLLGCPAFVVLWWANLASSLAGWSLGIAASVQVYLATSSPLATSGLLIASMLPAVALGSVAGVLADRVSRTRLLQIVSALRVAIVAILPLTPHAGIVTLYTVAILQSAAMQFFTPAEQAIVAQVVPVRLLPAALAANSAGTNITRLVAPAFGGALMSLVGFRWATTVVTVLLAAAAMLLWLLPDVPTEPAAPQSFWRDWLAGLHELRRNSTAAAVATLQLLDAAKEGALSALFPVLMLGVIGMSPTFMGVVNSSFAVTGVMAGPLIPLILRRCGYTWPIAVGATVSGLALLAMVLLPVPGVALVAFAVSGLPWTVSWVSCQTLLLVSTAPYCRARTVGTIGSLYSAATLISAAATGFTASAFGTTTVLMVASGVQIAAGPVFWMMRRTPHYSPGRI